MAQRAMALDERDAGLLTMLGKNYEELHEAVYQVQAGMYTSVYSMTLYEYTRVY